MTVNSPRGAVDEDARALDVAVSAARAAGEVLLAHHEKLDKRAIHSKSARRDLVSAADLASEAVLLDRLRAAFPADRILAEESKASGSGLDSPVWHLDPLDGTTNFVHGLPEFTISIARFVKGKPRVGVVFAPKLAELFAARAGAGSTCNGKPIHVSTTLDLADALLATGFPYRRDEVKNNNLDNFGNLLPRVRDLRRLGSAALDLAFVAMGRFDAYWELHLETHDVAAGGLLVAEAGGVVTDLDGGGAWSSGRTILASNGALHAPLLSLLKG